MSVLTVEKKPDPTPSSIYLLEKFVELNDAHQEALDKLKPGLWSRISSGIKGNINAFDVQNELLTTLNKQKEYVKPFLFYSYF